MADTEMTYSEHMNAVAKRSFYMEEVNSVTAEATRVIVDRLTKFGVVTVGDEYFDAIFKIMEKQCPNDYRNHL